MFLSICVVADTPSRYQHWLEDEGHEASFAFANRGDVSVRNRVHIISANGTSTLSSRISFANSTSVFAKEAVEFEHMLVVRRKREMLSLL